MKTLFHGGRSLFDLLHPAAAVSHSGCLLVFILAVLASGCDSNQQAVSATANASIAPVVAKAGPIIAARVGETPLLDGSKSSTSLTAPLRYSWSFAHKPDASNTTLQGKNSAHPSFVADASGVYTVQLIVSADSISSQRAIQIVVATVSGERLTGPFNHPGLSSDCVNCHNGTLVDPGKSPDHIGTSDLCQACHTPQGASIIPFVDHQEVFGNCSGCHDGTKAIGKSALHAPTDAECDNCHNTTSFLLLDANGRFDHSNITRQCSGCHNGTVATGKTLSISGGGTHPDTTSECINCHTTDSFLNAYPDHTGAEVSAQRCDACHGISQNDQPRDPPAGHPLVNVDCNTCHSIVTFSLGGVFSHHVVDASIQPCQSCHNDNNSINAPGKGSAAAHPNTSSDCGSCHNTESFTPAFSFDHTGITSGCSDSCHVADGSGTASGKPPATALYAHVPTVPDNRDCADCHTPGTFSTGSFDHAGISNGCNACHDNRISIGKLPSHIPTDPVTRDCADCHNSTVDFLDVTFSHAGITDNCESCHNTTITIGKPLDHLPTSQDCVNCHSTTDPFKPAINFSHAAITDNCESCHDGGSNHVTAGAIGKKTGHIPSLSQCSTCHSDTSSGGFATAALFLTSLHADFINGCEGCHQSRFLSDPVLLKSSSHLATSQDCHYCHMNTAFMPDIFAHKGITSNCSSCHDGSSSNISAGARGKTADHPVTGQDCGICHNTKNFADATFDHTGRVDNCAECHGDGATGAVTRKHAAHVTTSEDCSVCHVPGTFADAVFDHSGIIDNCASCHDGAGAVATVKTTDHLATAQDCSLCHNTTAFAGARFDHLGIVNNCVSCHDGVTARGKTPPPSHVPTNQDCSVCHQTTGFKPATFDHVGIVDNCSSCHDGAFARGKITSHLPTSQDCGVCHTTSSFIGAGFDHSGIVDNCESCHDGVTAIGKDAKLSPAHIATSLDCHSCHTTATFAGGTWTHDASSAGRCDDCHNTTGGGAQAKPSGHLNTTVQCDICHSTGGWAPDIFSHDPGGNYPGDHGRNPGCSACHGSTISDTLTWPWPEYAPFCAACHANDFDPKDKHIGGESGTVEQNKNCAGSGCHRVSSSEF